MALESDIPEGTVVPKTLYVAEPRLAFFSAYQAQTRKLPIAVFSNQAKDEAFALLERDHPEFFVSESLGCGRTNNRGLGHDIENVERARQLAPDVPTAILACCDNELTLPLRRAHQDGIVDAVIWPGYLFSHMSFGMRIVHAYAKAQENRAARLQTGT